MLDDVVPPAPTGSRTVRPGPRPAAPSSSAASAGAATRTAQSPATAPHAAAPHAASATPDAPRAGRGSASGPSRVSDVETLRVRSLRIGTFSVELPGGRWEWSDETYAMHGLPAGAVVPTLDLVAAHLHPEDAARTLTLLHRCLADGAPFATVTRVLGFDGVQRQVLLDGEGLLGPDGDVRGVQGRLVDLTGELAQAARAVANDQIAQALASRAVIDQAKGVLAGVYGFGPEAAFDVLRETSQRRNVRLRTLADAVLDAVHGPSAQLRARVDVVVGGARALP